jgi:arylsulfatase
VTSNTYCDYWIQNGILALVSQQVVAKFVETFKDFPAVQKPNTFTVDDALAKLSERAGGG